MTRRRSPTSTGGTVSVTGVTPFLWYDHEAEEAARLYTSIFRNSRITGVTRMGGEEAPAMVVTFELAGQSLIALNGGPTYRLTPAFSLQVGCARQEEVDELWERLSRGGKKGQCGWLEDRFGLSWQVIPNRLSELLSDPDPVKAGRVAEAMMKMRKIDVARLERAYREPAPR